MGKFSDSSYFLLEHYFELLNTERKEDIKSKIIDLWPVIFDNRHDDYWKNVKYFDYNDNIWNFKYETIEGPYIKKQVDWSYDGSYLTGGKKGIIAVGDRIIPLFVKDDTEFKEIHISPLWHNNINGNFFNFHKHITLQYKHGSTLTETLSGNAYYFEVYKPNITFDPDYLNDKEVYFRKDSQFHKWLTVYARDYFNKLWGEDFVIRNYVNTDKQFLYFGKIYNKRNDIYDEITGTYKRADKNLYHIEFYGMKDFVLNSIPYHQRTPKLTEFMEVEFDRNFQEIFNLLKNIWSLIDPYEVDEKYLGYLANFYNIKIDNYNILNQREFIKELMNYLKRKGSYGSFYSAWKIVTQGTLNNLIIYDKWLEKSKADINGDIDINDFEALPYTEQYNTLPFNINDYILTPYYKIQLDISSEPIQYNKILSKKVIEGLLYCFEDNRPANKVPEYEILLKPEVSLFDRLYALYESNKYDTNVLSSVKKFSVSVDGAYIALFGGEYTTFDVNHNLNDNNLFIRCYDMEYNEIVPSSIKFLDGDNIRVSFDHNLEGFMLIRKPYYTNIRYTDVDRWVIKHPFSQENVYVEFNKDKEKLYTDETILLNQNFISTNLKSGESNISRPDLVHIQNINSAIWEINHNLGYKGVLISCFDEENNEIIPKDVEFIDINNSKVIFENSIKGHAMIVSVGNPLFADMMLERVIENGEELFLLPFYEINPDGYGINFINHNVDNNNSQIYDYKSRVNSYYETDDALYLIINIPEDIEFTMRNLRIYDSSDNILIYTECGDIFKPMNVKMKIEYKINKYTTKGSL
jgi:hypothetical protein